MSSNSSCYHLFLLYNVVYICFVSLNRIQSMNYTEVYTFSKIMIFYGVFLKKKEATWILNSI